MIINIIYNYKKDKMENNSLRSLKAKLIDRLIILIIFIGIFLIINLLSNSSYKLYISLFLFVFFIYTLIILLLAHNLNPLNEKALENKEMPKKVPTVAVVTYAYNHFKGVDKTIERLIDLEYPIPFTVYVVNDGTMGYLKKYKKVKLITIDPKYFVKGQNIKAIIMNKAFKQLKEDNIFCVDGDSLPEKNALLKMTPLLNNSVAAVIGLVIPLNTRNLLEKMQMFEYNLYFGLWSRGLAKLNSVFVVVGPLNLINRQKFEEIGGFDIHNITEDADLAYAFQKKGYKIEHTILAKAKTEVPSTIKSFWRQRVRWYRGAYYTWLKYKSFFFSKGSGVFGNFVLPYLIFLNLLGIGLFLKFLIVSGYRFFVQAYYLISLQIANGIWLFKFDPSYFLYDPTFLIVLFVFACTILMAIFSFSFSGLKLKIGDIIPFFLFCFGYNFLIMVVYLYSLLLEFLGVKYKW